MQINREDVVQAALTVERWCVEHQDKYGNCDCPLAINFGHYINLCKVSYGVPRDWCLEPYLRNRGLQDGQG